jgi:formate hydrogenlyase subunit 4
MAMFDIRGIGIEIGQTVLSLLLAPALVGFIRWLKARLQGRRGAPVWQPYAELRKLFRKEMVVSRHASWVFTLAPFVVFGSTVVISLLVPVVLTPLPFNALADLFALVYLLLLGTTFLALAGLDTASAFGGMGSSREMTIAAISEPAIALAILSLALTAGSTNLGEIAARTIASPAHALSPGHLLAFVALFIVLLAETGRLPVDNPSTHLELTMIHEAMILEYSGPYLALIEWASWLKLFVFLVLAANLFVPWGLATSLDPAALAVALVSTVAKLAVLAAGIAVLETRVAKLRLFRVPELLAFSFVLGLLAVASSFSLR